MMPVWSDTACGGFIAAEAPSGTLLLAAYGQRRSFCWEVTEGGRGGPLIAHGEEESLADAKGAAELAAALHQLAGPPRRSRAGRLPRTPAGRA